MALGEIWGDIWNESIWDNPIWQQSLLPTLSSATIAFTGDTITLNFSKTVVFGAGGNGGFVVTMSGGASTMTYSSGAGTTALVYTLSRTVSADETGTLAYTQPGNGVEGSIIGDDLGSFAGFAVTVGSQLLHNRQMRHTRVTLYHEDITLVHKDPTISFNE